MADVRKTVAEQIGMLVLTNIELNAANADLQQKVEALGQRLHAAADGPERTGQVPPADEARGS